MASSRKTDSGAAATVHEAADPAGRGGLHLVIILVGVAAALLALQGITHYAALVAPVFFAINMVIIVHPLHAWLVRVHHWPTWAAAAVSLVTVLVALVAFFYSIGWAIFALIRELPSYSGQFEVMWTDLLNWLGQFGVTTEGVAANLQNNVSNIVSFSTDWLVGVASNISGVAAMMAVIVTVLFFLTMDSMTITRRMRVIIRQKPATARALLNFAAGVRRYWVVTTIFGLIVALMDLGYLVILGVPLAGVWAVLAFVSNYIPNIGFIIGMVPPALMALLDGGWTDALLVVIGFSVINVVMQSFIQPKFTGDAVGVTPTVSFISVLLWAAVLGPLGALLALPATLLVKALLIDPNPQARFVNALIAATPEDGLPSHQANAARAAQGRLARWISGTRRKVAVTAPEQGLPQTAEDPGEPVDGSAEVTDRPES
ncbi:AI-2E family transporter [Kocuria sp.]|uniref:AI-2E family transporter n=1 Tax=Kocuria sp. TaxID=1871328 RepID=UPI0026E0BD10|nr:AI-2E family transporter [Kocuria sp.]MDO5617220.1 AI-2E family transporter [Kocuria sp.]